MTQNSAADMLNFIQRDYDTWSTHLAGMGRARMETAGVAGEWSAKDIVAHITWHENEMLELLRTRVLTGSELWTLPTDERNEVIYQQNRSRALSEVVEEASRIHTALVEEVRKLKDSDLDSEDSIRDMIPGVTLWEMLASNTFEHYQEHIEHLVAWLESH